MNRVLLSTDTQCARQALADLEGELERTSLPADGRRAVALALRQCAAPTDAVHQLM